MSYETEIVNKKYVPNIVIEFKGFTWAIRQPDSGLVVDYPGMLDQVTINPTKIDPKKANTTINSYSFKLLDKKLVVTGLFQNNVKFFLNEEVKIYVGRSGVNMPFSDYLELPTTYVSGVSKETNAYNFSSKEAKDRLNRPAFNVENKLEVDILAATTTIDTVISIAEFQATGMIKIDNEYISYTGLDLVNNRFTGCVRGEKTSVPEDHSAGATIYEVTEVSANPVDILLQVLVSSGGGSSYDVLPDGAGIDQSLVNITKFEAIRDEFFDGQEYELLFYGIDNILKFLEEQILFPNDLRIITDDTSKVSLVILNRNLFDDAMPIIDEDSIKAQPTYRVDDTDIVNQVNIQYDYVEGTDTYLKTYTSIDQPSINDYGKREPIKLNLKGVKSSLDGDQIVTDIAQRFLSRFSQPRPEISFTTHMDKSLVNLADKVQVTSNQIPSDTGELVFAETVEVLERGINFRTGDVKFKVGFTSFTGVRECYLAPSDTAITFVDDFTVEVGSGRGALYQVGWMMRLYDNETRDYASTQVNEIAAINGDEITFVDEWEAIYLGTEDGFRILQEDGFGILISGPTNNRYRIMFADYDQVVEQQKRYCFISNAGLPFADGKKSYQINL